MKLRCLSLTHRDAELDLRERARPDAAALLQRLKPAVAEATVISTCNRSEVYWVPEATPAGALPDPGGSMRPALKHLVLDTWATACGADAATLEHHAQGVRGGAAVRHLFRVAAGLDSAVVGEAEVLGQVRRAYELACDVGTAGPVIHGVFQSAVATARHARNASGLSAEGGSLASAAIRFVTTVFESLQDKTVLCLGAGEINDAVLRRVMRRSPRRLILANRTLANAEALRDQLLADPTLPQGSAAVAVELAPWSALETALEASDVAVFATGAEDAVLDLAAARAVQKRRRRPWLLLDLAMPRNVEASIKKLSDVYLVDLDAVQAVVADDPARAVAESACAELVDGAAMRCHRTLEHRELGRMVAALRGKLHDLAEAEADRTRRRLRRQLPQAAGVSLEVEGGAAETMDLEDTVNRALAEHNRRLINKLLHVPLNQLKRGEVAETGPGSPTPRETTGAAGIEAEGPSMGFYATALRRLFELEG